MFSAYGRSLFSFSLFRQFDSNSRVTHRSKSPARAVTFAVPTVDALRWNTNNNSEEFTHYLTFYTHRQIC